VHDRELDSVVALKTLEKLAPEQVYRLKQEFRALAGIVHPNLVQLHELVVTAETCFFTMEYVAGADFVEHVRRDASTTSHDESILQRFVNAAPQLVEALAAVHAAGRLHRDVKPANVRVTPQGRVVLLDFDLAARLADGQARDTLSGSFAGTYAYMAPEQA